MGWGWGGRGMGGLERTYANFTSLTDASSHGSSLSCFFVIPYLSPNEPWTRGSSRLRVSGVTSWTFVPALEADSFSYKFPSRQGSRAKLADSETMLIFKLGIQTFVLQSWRLIELERGLYGPLRISPHTMNMKDEFHAGPKLSLYADHGREAEMRPRNSGLVLFLF